MSNTSDSGIDLLDTSDSDFKDFPTNITLKPTLCYRFNKLKIVPKVCLIFVMFILIVLLIALTFIVWWFSPCIYLSEDYKIEGGYIEPRPIQVPFLTLNMFLRTTFITNIDTSNVDDYKNQRMRYFIENEMSRFGILALQETWMMGSDRKKIIIDAAREKGYQYVRSVCRSPFQYGMDSMLLQLSHHPILNHDEHTYTTSVGEDALAAKGVLWTRIAIGGHDDCTIDIYNTHLQAGSKGQRTQVRQQQLEELKKFMEENDKKYGSFAKVIAGDLNTRTQNITNYQYIVNLFPTFTDLQYSNTNGNVTNTNSEDSATLDYIFFDPNGSKISVILNKTTVEPFKTEEVWDTISDHSGISTMFICRE